MNEPTMTRAAKPDRPTIAQVERHRGQLLALSLFLVAAFSVALVGASFMPGLQFSLFGDAQNVIRVSLILLPAMFVVYIAHRERILRRVGDDLIDEKVMSAALRNQMRQLALLAEASRSVASSGDVAETLHVVLRASVDLLEADEGSIFLLDANELVLSAASGSSERFLGHRQPITEGVAGYVARTSRPLLIQGELDMADLFDVIDTRGRRELQVRSAISVPLRAGQETVGVMSLNVITGDRAYEEYDRQTLELFAHQAAIAVLQSRLLRSVGRTTRERAAQLDEMRSDLVESLATSEGAIDTEALEIATPTRRSARRNAPRVLVADDDAALLHFLQVALETEDLDVILASDGATALERIDRDRPDVVLLDLALPVMDGWRVLEALRERPHAPRVICISASNERRDQMRAWMLGIHEYVAKPFDVSYLATTVRRVLHTSGDQHAERRDEALNDLFAVR